MIIWRPKGRLANQMIQYVAVRQLADRLGSRWYYRDSELENAFALADEPLLTRMAQHLSRRRFRRWLGEDRKPWYRGHRIERWPGVETEAYDPDFFNITPPVVIASFCQAIDYIKGYESQARQWFTLQPALQAQLDAFEKTIPAPPENRCSIHVRRTDYISAKTGVGHPETGWILPESYYQNALSQLPTDELHFVILSDDPDYAEAMFAELPYKTVSRANPGPVDLMLHTRCRINLIANSTFSWMGAWLNDTPNRRVLMPEFFFGWYHQSWHPDRFQPPGWEAIPVDEQ